MTDEERQKQMDFILEHQAKFAVEIEQSNHRLARLERIVMLGLRAGVRERRNVRNIEAKIAALTDAQIKNEDIQRRNSEDIRVLINSQMETKEIAWRNSEDIKMLIASQERNTENINALAETVRLLVERPSGNGKP